MQKVIVINLNGHAYQLDEMAYDALRAYLDRAERQLAGNPDRAEIMTDLEQAIAEKCQKYVGAHKSVVLSEEVDRIITEMGPVEADAGGNEDAADPSQPSEGGNEAPKDRPTSEEGAPRRLYRIREGARIAGVCNGLAAFFGLDVTIVRVLFALLIVLSKGFGILAYFALAFLLPEATTSEERAAAHGEPFNAREVMGRIRKDAHTAHRERWNRHWRRATRSSRRATVFARRMSRWGSGFRARADEAWGATAPPLDYTSQVLLGLVVPIFAIIRAGLFILLVLAIMSLIETGGVFGFSIPADVPLWASILMLVVLFHMITSPLRAVRHPAFLAYEPFGLPAVWGGILWVAFLAFLVWYGVEHTEEVREFLQTTLPDAMRSLREFLRDLRAEQLTRR